MSPVRLLNLLKYFSTDHRFGCISGPGIGACRERETVPRKLPRFHRSLPIQVFGPRNVRSADELVSLDTIRACITCQRVEERGLLSHRSAEFSVVCCNESEVAGWRYHEVTMGGPSPWSGVVCHPPRRRGKRACKFRQVTVAPSSGLLAPAPG